MAITQADVLMIEDLRQRGELPQRGRVLQLGECNWYGDSPDAELNSMEPYAAAREFLRRMFNYRELSAVDLQGPTAMKMDLNGPLPGLALYPWDVVINTGTAEHVFNQAQVFKTIHDCCKKGGLILHNAPHFMEGHGFYNYTDHLFTDVAAANHYDRLYARVAEIGGGTMFVSAYRKTGDKPFVIPFQRSIGP
jgi:hypothetical protein